MTVDEFELRWSGGTLNLQGWNDGPHGPFRIETLPSGTDWGNPEPFRRALRRYLLDGSTSVKEYDDNRDVTLSLRVSAPDGAALAGGEIPLALADTHTCELVWTPRDNRAPAVVFVAVAVDLRRSKNDADPLAERGRRRYYTLALDCLPYAFSAEWVEVPALPQDVSVRTEFDSCAVLTDWSSSGVTLTDGGDFIQVTFPAGVDSGTATRTGAVDFTTNRYLAVTGDVDGVEVETASGWTSVYQVSAAGGTPLYDVGAAVTAIRFQFRRSPGLIANPSGPAGRLESLAAQETVRTAAVNGMVRTVQVPGSRRTPATVELTANTGTLGDVVVYSGPNYDPSLEGRQVLGDPHQVSDASPVAAYRWPVAHLPAGDYVVWADITANVTGLLPDSFVDVTFSARLYNSAGTQLRTLTLATLRLADGSSELRPLFAATLPGWDIPEDSPHQFEFNVTMTLGNGDAVVEFPAMWLFNVSTGQLTVVKAGSATHVWLEPASLTRDHSSVWVGDTTLAEALPLSLDDAVPAWGGSQYVEPEVASMYTWSSDSTDVSASARFRAAWHTHPAS